MVGHELVVLFTQLHLVQIGELGHDLDGGEGGLTAACGVEGGHADETVYAMLALEVAVGVGALHHDGGGLDTGGVAVLPVEKLDLKAVALGPTVDHAVEHLAPVLGLSTARAGVEGDDGGGIIVFAAHQHLNALMLGLVLDGLQLGLDLLQRALVLLLDGHLAQSDGVLQTGYKIVIAVYSVLVLLNGLQNFGGVALVAPEIGSQSLLLQFLCLGGQELHTERLSQLLDIGSQTHKLVLGFFQLYDHDIYLTSVVSV